MMEAFIAGFWYGLGATFGCVAALLISITILASLFPTPKGKSNARQP
jgi:hypothetical protein